MTKVCIFGLGYVGRAVAQRADELGYEVTGVEVDPDVVASVQEGTLLGGTNVAATTDAGAAVEGADVIVTTVPTPLDSSHNVDLSAVTAVTEQVAESMPDDPPLFVTESTVPPGTVRDIVVPTFESHGHVPGEDVYVAHVPERIDPGNDDEWPLESIPRVAGAVTERGRERTREFYEDVIDAPVHVVDDPAVAEASKIIENSYRDINIAFVNEVAMALEKLDVDATAALDAAETKPFGFTRFYAGAGVGGHCIPIDPYFLIRKAGDNGFNNRFLKHAREVNERMPHYVTRKTVETLNDAEILPNGSRVVLLGVSFKPNVDDTRNSPYYVIKTGLKEYGVTVETYDPHLPGESTVDSPYVDADAVVVVTDHDQFEDLSFDRLASRGVGVVVDGRNMFVPDEVTAAGLEYTGVGR